MLSSAMAGRATSDRLHICFALAIVLCSYTARGEASPLPSEEFNSVTAPQTPEHTNRLANETSPYLLQHAHNPVDWYPWGDEAIARARAEDKPIFLSIGYSACHWCHVMERESFENETVAEILNKNFVCIKVDREERPDIDEIYMSAVQIMTGGGGWPMSVWLTPDLKPFYGGTYYPPEDLSGRPGFKTVLNSIAQAWSERRDEVSKSAEQLTQYVKQSTAAHPAGPGELSYGLVTGAVAELSASYDRSFGGFGGAPKFPSAPSIELLLRHYHNTGDRAALKMATATLTRMFCGGIYDHLGGGFHRYSVDAQWLVPHFEKMLYDNAQLAPVYLEAYQATGDKLFAHVARGILDYELRDMQDKCGGFYSSEDADSEGREGTFYLWTQEEVVSVLGDTGGRMFCQYYNVLPDGNFGSHEPYHAGQNIVHVTRPAGAAAKEFDLSVEEFEEHISRCHARLLAVRDKRVRPGLDDKILTSWNGLMISALAQGYQVLGEDRYRVAAERAAQFVLDNMRKDGKLLRTHRNGQSRLLAYLDDYAFTAVGLIDLYEATFDERWLNAADDLARGMIDMFRDTENGGFYSTTQDHAHLIARTKPVYDGAEPSGNSMAAIALQRLARLRDNTEYAETARQVLTANAPNLASSPRAYMKMLCAVDFELNPPKEIAVVGDAASAATRELLSALYAQFIPNRIVACADTSKVEGDIGDRIPLLEGKSMVDGKPAAYVCKNYTCQLPVTTPEGLVQALAGK